MDPDTVLRNSEGKPWLVLRPDIPWIRYSALAAFWTAVFLAATFLPYRGQPVSEKTRRAIEIILAAFILLGALRLTLISRFSRLRSGRDALIFVNSIGLSRRLARDSVRKIVIASYGVRVRSSVTFSYYLFLDQNGRALLKLPTKWWPEQGIDAVGQALGVLVTGTFGTLDGPTFRRQFPGSISWVAAHPLLIGAVLFLPALFLIVVLITLVTGQSLESAGLAGLAT